MKDFKTLEWILGQWEGIQGSGLYHEGWEKINDKEFKGKAFMIRKGEILNHESLKLHYGDSGIFYTADVAHNPQPVSFEMTFLDENKVVFENPHHDFPQKITYERKKNDILQATIESLQKGKLRKVEFKLRKIIN